jgi:hypothetical protein
VSLTENVCPALLARIITASQLPAVLAPGNASVEEVVVPALLLACWTNVIAVWVPNV